MKEHVHASRVELGLAGHMKGNDLVANQLRARKTRQIGQSSQEANESELTDILPRSKPSGNVACHLVAIYIAKLMHDSECLKQSDVLAINLSEAHSAFVYPP
jgi:hypothetical protein